MRLCLCLKLEFSSKTECVLVYTDIGKHTFLKGTPSFRNEGFAHLIKDFIKARLCCGLQRWHWQHEASTASHSPLQLPRKNKLRFKSDIYFANAVDINQESNPAVIEMTILSLASPRKLRLSTEFSSASFIVDILQLYASDATNLRCQLILHPSICSNSWA